MAKGAGIKLSRSLKSILKKWKSSSSSLSSSSTTTTNLSPSSSSRSTDEDSLHPVYVGKSRRRYLISSQVVDHPLFQELADKSSSDGLNVGCEVVLFEHLLWMLENADSDLQDLVHFYAC